MPLNVRASCVVCPTVLPRCNCATGQRCQISGQDCNNCPTANCINEAPSGAPPQSNPGTVAGTVVGILALVGVLVALWVFYRRRQSANSRSATERGEAKPDVPASASSVLSRPDPIEKSPASPISPIQSPAKVYGRDDRIILNPDPNPFSDQASIATAPDQVANAKNAIPIAYVPTISTPPSRRDSDLSSAPSRPQRDPTLNLHLNPDQGRDSLLPPKSPFYAGSERSGVSGISAVSSRASYMSTASSAIDFVNDAPQIVTPMQGGFRQVLGVSRAEVVQLPSTPSSPSGLHPRFQRSTTLGRSPLAQTSFSLQDSADYAESSDPFSDSNHDPSRHASKVSLTNSFSSTSTFGSPHVRSPTEWSPIRPAFPTDSRPSSVSTQNGTIIASITNATVVTLGRQSSVTHHTLADYSTPNPEEGTFPPVPTRHKDQEECEESRNSVASSMNRTSTTDSILEAFPFVPPSPISEFSQHSQLLHCPNTPGDSRQRVGSQNFPSNPSRHTLGMSTMSSASSALDGYTFQFGSADVSLMPPLPLPGVAESVSGDSAGTRDSQVSRASLDTLALSRELEAFPLSFDSPATPRASDFSAVSSAK